MGSTIIITVTGFSGAIGQWAPFSMVSLILRYVWFSQFISFFRNQLGEAILTERIPQSESMAIRLVDTLSPRPAEDPEREFLVPGVDSDDEDDNEEEAKRLKKNGLLTHSGARVSISDLTEVDENDDGYEVLDHGSSGRRGPDAGTLSSKAGIILVRTFSFFCLVFNPFCRAFTTSSLSFPNSSSQGLLPFSSPLPIPQSQDVLRPPRVVLSRTALFICFGMFLLSTTFFHKVYKRSFFFSLGGVASLLAFVLTWRLARELLHR